MANNLGSHNLATRSRQILRLSLILLFQFLKETVSVETTEKKETLLYNAYLLAGVIGFGSAVVLGIVSLPSVSRSLSWQEFRLIQVTF